MTLAFPCLCSASTSAIMRNSNSIMVFLLLAILSLCKPNSLACNEKEKQALLRFKQALTDPANSLSSWSLTEDCCGWAGVRCNNVSGRVVELHLGNTYDPYAVKFNGRSALRGEISPALLELEHLNFLDLSTNDFGGAPIPSFLGSMRSLRHLDLWGASFGGLIPHQLGNLSSLRHLHLGGNSGLYVENFSWISLLSSLVSLDMTWIDLHRDAHWLDSICRLSSLIVLDLADNRLSGFIPKCLKNISAMATSPSPIDDKFNALKYHIIYIPYTENILLVIKGRESRYCSILPLVRIVDLSSNNLSGGIPSEISSLFGLQSLNLSRNNLMGRIPEKIGVIGYLESLDLSNNHLSGEVPQSIINLTFLSHLDLSYNNFSGRIPSSTQLQSFDALDFIGNPELCGAPLLKTAQRMKIRIPVMKMETASKDHGFILVWRAWRHAYFKFLDNIKDRVYVATVLKLSWLRYHFRRYRISLRCPRICKQQRMEERGSGES
ncbi:receptor-like protein EIX2 [Vitis riparia]|uniref:receptor-like protein EIX2 n=1 Tax=Vitis riparia TaxID=96939 RepID=UPI00155B2199|nr:receptor-like protein EIX2 [Vitis riparia]